MSNYSMRKKRLGNERLYWPDSEGTLVSLKSEVQQTQAMPDVSETVETGRNFELHNGCPEPEDEVRETV